MSLVQEALKRKSQEELNAAQQPKIDAPSSTPTPPPPPPPPAPPETPDAPMSQPPPPPQPPKKSGGVKAILIWLLILVFLGGLSYATYFLLSKHFAGSDLLNFAKEEKQEDPEATPTPRPLSQRSKAYRMLKKTKDITDKEHQTQVEATTLLEPEVKLAPEPTPTSIPVVESSPTATPAPAKTVEVAPEQRPEKKPKTTTVKKRKTTRRKPTPVPQISEPSEEPKAPVEWPKIRLNGVMAKRSSTDGLAVIDGNVTSCGQEVEGCKLISVHDDGVVLEYEGEIRTLRVGGQMY